MPTLNSRLFKEVLFQQIFMVCFDANKNKTPYEAMHNFDSLAFAFSCNHAARNIA